MVPTLADRPARAGQPHRHTFTKPEVGDVVVFHPPEGAEPDNPCGSGQPPAGKPCAKPTAERADVNFIKRIVAGPGDRLKIDDGRVVLNGKLQEEPFAEPCGGGRRMRLPDRDHDSGRSLLHDGRQPWLLRRQPLLGTRPREVDHRRSLRHLLASEAHRPPLEKRTSGQSRPVPLRPRPRLPLRRRRRRGRPRLPRRPAGRRGRAVRLRGLSLSDRRALTALNDSKQHKMEMREELYPRVLRAACKVAVTSRCVRGIDERGLHKTNLAALSRHAAARRRRRLHLPVATASRSRRRASSSAPSSAATRRRRDRRRLGDRQGHARPLHAADRGALPGLGVRGPRRLLDARAPRRDRAARRLAAAPAVVPVDGLLAARAVDSAHFLRTIRHSACVLDPFWRRA